MKKYIKTEIIENFLKENNLSKTKFCKECRISYSTLMKHMYGDPSNCGITCIFRIAKRMKIEAYELFTD